jgi:hypothetical protein
LWLSNPEFLPDKWEVMPTSQQLNTIMSKRPPSLSAEVVMDRTKKAVTEIRKQTFVNCWTASEHESFALWQMYCPSPEGVVIQTTFEGLKKSVELIDVLEVAYGPQNTEGAEVNAIKLATQKRPMFEYEHEVRIVLMQDYSYLDNNPDRKWFGTGIYWDPEVHIESIRLHPKAEAWFMQAVTKTVLRLAPKLSLDDGSPNVAYSEMSVAPPF